MTCSSPGDHGAVTLGVFSQQDGEDLLPLPIKERIVLAGEEWDQKKKKKKQFSFAL